MGDFQPASFDEIVGHIEAGRLNLANWVSALDPATVERFLHEGRHALEELPVPIGTSARGPGIERRRAVERLLGRLRARQGDYGLFLRAERAAWLKGGSHLVYLLALRAAQREPEAAVLARTLLSRERCPEREELEEFVASLSSPPEGWENTVAALAEDPTLDRWEALWRFTPEDLRYERVRHTLSLLLRLGVDAERVFELATWQGVVPDAIELIEKGLVRPQVVEARADRSTPEGRPMWLGLAARAACARGDRLGTVRLLRQALRAPCDLYEPDLDVGFIRDHADEELHQMLDRSGVPRRD